MERLSDHSDFATWTVAKGRYQACSQLLELIAKSFEIPFENVASDGEVFEAVFLRGVGTLPPPPQRRPLLSLSALDPALEATEQSGMIISRLAAGMPPAEVALQTLHLQQQQQPQAKAPRPGGGQQESKGRQTQSSPPRRVSGDIPAGSTLNNAETLRWPLAADNNNAAPAITSSSKADNRRPSPSPVRPQHKDHSHDKNVNVQTSKEKRAAVSWTVDAPAKGGQPPSTTATVVSKENPRSVSAERSRVSFGGNAAAVGGPVSVASSIKSGNQHPHHQPQQQHREEPAHSQQSAARRASSPATKTASPPAADTYVLRSPDRSTISSIHHASPVKKVSPGQSKHHQTVRQHDPQQPLEYNKALLLQSTGIPFRCLSLLEHRTDDDSMLLAVGSNNREVHLLRYHFNVEHHDDNEDDHSNSRGHISHHKRDARVLQDESVSTEMEATFANLHKGSVYCMDYSPLTQTLITGSNDATLRVISPYENEKEAVKATLKGHSKTVRCVRFNAAQDIVASAGAGDFRPRIWDIESSVCTRILTAHHAAVHGLCWLNDVLFVTGDEQGVIVAHDTRSSQQAWSLNIHEVLGLSDAHDMHTRSISCLQRMNGVDAAAGSGAVNELAVGCMGGQLTLIHDQRLLLDIQLHTEDVRTILEAPWVGRNALLSASYDGTAAMWEIAPPFKRAHELQCRPLARMQAGHVDKVLDAVVVDNGYRFVTSGADGRVVLWTAME